jgi:glycyl-tRNA synthetase alpha subunit
VLHIQNISQELSFGFQRVSYLQTKLQNITQELSFGLQRVAYLRTKLQNITQELSFGLQRVSYLQTKFTEEKKYRSHQKIMFYHVSLLAFYQVFSLQEA